ncbi:MAG: beta-CASP ribonuclease aCPSF1 [Candidatus Thalassarchaeaceae archaeon]|jgi:KH/beta-lactamase-domain protein|uniref:Transcription termination factor FttA n=1 Tax=uncultured Poseidoniia archaeon TaxID=1697135 RepID=A0A1B1TDR3_9ARCH|nr:mRNA cleavage/polyadenylation specificity factor, 100 kD subunit [uncultured Candidatus Thalassoarchaea sp.]ANV80385.1 mRNA cleavage/polyadenylation specificity factor, 100 kD subunit [uncultured Candidatus Thalassoarchaea sp.]ANV80425.1 mRNA cleavage/polyadenylation specificity factor, 100 kD subunit [uncultured Candidatus Thalassoarchaea sp.]
MRLSLTEIKKRISKIIPNDIEYDVDLEAGSISIITKQPSAFIGSGDSLTVQIAKSIKRRVVIRPHPSILCDESAIHQAITKFIPSEVGVINTWLDPALSEVILECDDPSTAVGPKGINIQSLRDEIGWLVKVVRAPAIASRTQHDIRRYRKEMADDRKSLLRKFGTRIYRPKRPGVPWVRVTALGSYREVGRAMHLVTTNESKILIDCGAKPTTNRDETQPFFSAPELLPLDNLDAIVITHAHVDHIGMLPVLFKYGYRGPVYCTPPTRDLMTLLQIDYIKVAQAEGNDPPYSKADIQECIKHTVDIDWGDKTDIAPDVKITLENAGHILGSSSVYAQIGEGNSEHKLLFSGDIKYEKSWLFDAATVRFPKVDTLVIESTYGGPQNIQPTRQQASHELQDLIIDTLNRGGKIFSPVFAVGRSQEVMIAIDELFKSGKVKPVTVWLDGMISEATAIHSSHPNFLNRELRKQLLKGGEHNPFNSPWFKQVESHKQRESILLDTNSCIVLATSGMMTGGPIVEYFKHWAPEPGNTLCFVGYQASGTLGRRLQDGHAQVPLMDRGQTLMIEVNCNMVIIDGFSGHSDRNQLMDYVAALHPTPRKIICHHGDPQTCNAFRQGLREKFKVQTYAPNNLETLRLS